MLHEDKLSLTWNERLSIALQAAKGINYLHQLQEPIIHRDIKSLNFLLERAYEGYAVKVCDFGVARTRDETIRETYGKPNLVITLPWSAPEILRLERHTEKSDIYSLGITYWELAARNRPYENHANDNIRASVLAGNRLPMPENTPANFRVVINKCWAQEPQDRPSSSEIIQMVEKCMQIQGNVFSMFWWDVGGTYHEPQSPELNPVRVIPRPKAEPLKSSSQVKLKTTTKSGIPQ
ncbi:unnamed protein product [Rotaria sp. Silwood2]|nr:unnamed protein product [Rotaria sp. Silwood2]